MVRRSPLPNCFLQVLDLLVHDGAAVTELCHGLRVRARQPRSHSGGKNYGLDFHVFFLFYERSWWRERRAVASLEIAPEPFARARGRFPRVQA